MFTQELELIFDSKELNNESKEKRLFNINAFSSLDRSKPLEFGKYERLLLMHTTQNNEKIYIKFPGKESVQEKQKRDL